MRKIATKYENKNLWKIEVTCDGNGWNQNGKSPCYSLFEVECFDIRKRIHTDISGCSDTYYGFVCPDCGCFTEISSKKIPFDVRSKAINYN